MKRRRVRSLSQPWFLCGLGLFQVASVISAQVGTVASEQKINEIEGGFGGVLDPSDYLGTSVCSLGDLDGDGNPDLAVGAYGDDDGANVAGAVWILFLNADGTVASEQKISATEGGLGGVLAPFDLFGMSVASLGDLDDDGITDLAVGTAGDDDGGDGHGAVWILFLNADGTVASKQKISDTEGGFGGILDASDGFGRSVCSLGDLNGDGNQDLAVGATGDDDGGTNQGAVWILFLDDNGTVDAEQKISETAGNFAGSLDPNEGFALSATSLGDLDGDGTPELAVGAYWDNDGGTQQGAVWILFLNADGTVDSEQKISETTGGFGGVLDVNDGFGTSLCSLGDFDGDGNRDLAVGAMRDDDGDMDQGAVWILFLNADGTVASEQKISETSGDFGGVLDPGDYFGFSVCSLGDLDGDGNRDLAVGAAQDYDGAFFEGAVWILFLDGPGFRKTRPFTGPLGSVVVPYPLQADPSPDRTARCTDVLELGAELALDFSYPRDEPILRFQVTGARVELSDGAKVHVLYEPGPEDEGRTMSVFADLSVLFPRSTSATVLHLAARPQREQSFLGQPRFHGGTALRSGSRATELAFVSARTPRAGEEWQAWVDVSTHPTASASLVWMSDKPLSGRATPFGELLLDLYTRKPLLTSVVRSSGATDVHSFLIPLEVFGRSFSLQALILDEGRSALTNALDLVVGEGL